MKLPSHLAQSRHGVFYFRLTYFIDSVRREKRWSLHTKNPVEAKKMSLQLCAALRDNSPKHYDAEIPDEEDSSESGCKLIHQMGSGAVAEERWLSLITTFQTPGGRKVEMKIDQNDPKDIAAGQTMIRTILQEETKLSKRSDREGAVNESPQFKTGIQSGQTDDSGATINELIERYKVRKEDCLGLKTLSEYEGMQRKFSAWICAQRNSEHILLCQVNRSDISSFIDFVKSEGASLQTIQKKYLSALNGLFEFAQSAGKYPSGDLPSKNHKIYTQRDKKRDRLKSENKMFSDDDLLRIFDPKNLLSRNKPCDYWLPLLGLFTGGRISELCQLKPSDILQIDGIWAIDINDEDEDQSVKSVAGIRKIPLHPLLIGLGFLEYLDDVRQYEGTIFPYMTADRFKNYSKTPGRRFGEYMDSLGLSDKSKVFHSFRSTSNNRLKQNGVPEESRCQYIGHDHDTVNSAIYSGKHSLQYLLDNVVSKLTFDSIDFNLLNFQREKHRASLAHLMENKNRASGHKKAQALRDKGISMLNCA